VKSFILEPLQQTTETKSSFENIKDMDFDFTKNANERKGIAISELPKYIKKKYRGSSKSFRRKPVRRSLQRPKLSSQIIEDTAHIRPHLSALPKTFNKSPSRSKTKSENKKKYSKNPFKISPKNEISKKESTLMPKSIVPNESYTQIVGSNVNVKSSALPASPRIRSKSVKDTKSQIKKSNTQANMKMDKKPKSKSSKKLTQLRNELQEKYRKQNSMSHTPDIRSSRKPSERKVQMSRSITTDIKKLKNTSTPQSITIPYIKEPIRNRKFTLVLDLDETLIHFKNIPGKSKFLIRPHCYKFLRNLHSHFELIIFTAAQQQYADWIIDKIDPKVGFLMSCLNY
jgi:TFIIF-interacting CTD phosphatase-like protein